MYFIVYSGGTIKWCTMFLWCNLDKTNRVCYSWRADQRTMFVWLLCDFHPIRHHSIIQDLYWNFDLIQDLGLNLTCVLTWTYHLWFEVSQEYLMFQNEWTLLFYRITVYLMTLILHLCMCYYAQNVSNAPNFNWLKLGFEASNFGVSIVSSDHCGFVL